MATDKLRRYELIYLVQPEAEDEARETASGAMLKILEESGATVIKNEDWGKRKLAYEIDKVNKAYYSYLEFIAKPGVTHEMERVLRTIFRVRVFDTRPSSSKRVSIRARSNGIFLLQQAALMLKSNRRKVHNGWFKFWWTSP